MSDEKITAVTLVKASLADVAWLREMHGTCTLKGCETCATIEDLRKQLARALRLMSGFSPARAEPEKPTKECTSCEGTGRRTEDAEHGRGYHVVKCGPCKGSGTLL